MWVELKSSNVKATSYDAEKEELYIQFNSKAGVSTYRYKKVPYIIFDGLCKTYSPGKYIFQILKKLKYEYEKIETKEEE